MKKKLMILVALLLAMTMLAGCGTQAGKPETTQEEGTVPSTAPQGNAAEAAEPTQDATGASGEPEGYRTQYLRLQDPTLTAGLENGTAIGETIYFTSLGVIEDNTPEGITPDWPEQYWTYGPVLCRTGADGSIEKVPYAPTVETTDPGDNCGVVFETLCAMPDGKLWIVEKHYHYWNDAPETMMESDPEYGSYFHSDERYQLTCVREDGSLVSSFSLDALQSHAEEMKNAEGDYGFEIPGMAMDEKGRICLAVHEWFSGKGSFIQDNRICLLDADSGNVMDTFPMNNTPEYMTPLRDGSIAICCFESGSERIGLLDLETKSLRDSVAINDYVSGMTAGSGAYTVYYSAGDSFYGLDLVSGESKKLLNWIDCDVARQGSESVCVLPDGRIVTTASGESAGRMENDLIVLSPVEKGAFPERKTLHLAVMNLYPFTSAMVSRFNRSNTEYRIEVTDYSQYNDYSSANEEDWNAGITRLQTEIIAGDVPDLLDISLLSAERLGSKGILTDLYPYIDADPEFGREDLLEHVLEAFDEDGKLYQTVGNFYVLTTAGMSEVVGDKIGWNMSDFEAAMQRLQAENPNCTVFDRYTTKDLALTFLLYLDLENFVDWNTGECRFDTEEFIHFLEFVKSFPTVFDWQTESGSDLFDQDTRLRMGLQLMKQCNFACFEDLQVNTIGLSGAPCTFIGYPTENGVGSMFAQIGNSIAITSSCPDKEAAWQFVREFFLPDYQEQFLGSVFPTNRSTYEKMKLEAMTPRYQRNPDGSYTLNAEGQRIEEDRGDMIVNGVSYPYKTVTEDEIAVVEQIIAATDSILHTDSSLKEIIVDGAAPYFADQRSVEEVTKLIQSKAMLYVNEQR